MNNIQKLQTYGETHHPKWLDVLRMLLGLILFIKGLYYISNNNTLDEILKTSKFPMSSLVIVHYVAFAHLLGGALILIGLVTRIAILFQIPVLLGAIIFVHAQDGLLSATNTNLWFAVLVLMLLIFFFIYGSGPWSVDALLDRNKKDWDVVDM